MLPRTPFATLSLVALLLLPTVAAAQQHLRSDSLSDVDVSDTESDAHDALVAAAVLCERARDAPSRALAADAVARLKQIDVALSDLANARLCVAELTPDDVGARENALEAVFVHAPNPRLAWLTLIDLALATARPRRAFSLLAMVLDEHPRNAAALLRLARARALVGDRLGALEVLDRLEFTRAPGTNVQQVRDAMRTLSRAGESAPERRLVIAREMAELQRVQTEMQRRMQVRQGLARAATAAGIHAPQRGPRTATSPSRQSLGSPTTRTSGDHAGCAGASR